VILSAIALPEHIERLLAAGAHEYLTKPLEVDKLMSVLQDV
jgi:CheY-like chemotaxis protein